jgi:hypothetical protein
VALQSAAVIHGSSQQAVMETQVMTDAPHRGISVGRGRIHFFMKSSLKRSITQQLPGGYAPLHVSTPETTAFDLVRYAHNLGGIERMLETISPLAPSIRAPALRQVLKAEDEIATAQRLGFIFERTGARSLAKVVRDWLPVRLQTTPLSIHTNAAPSGLVNETWRVIVNTGDTS